MAESLESRFQNLHEFVTQARTNLDRNNWDYLIGGSETETTLARNRLALDAIGFRPRVLRDVSNIDCSSSRRSEEQRDDLWLCRCSSLLCVKLQLSEGLITPSPSA
jgi:glycolate oxidase